MFDKEFALLFNFFWHFNNKKKYDYKKKEWK